MWRAATMVVVTVLCSCGGSIEPAPVPVVKILDPGMGGGFPPLEGCVGDEVVAPRSDVRLLARLAATPIVYFREAVISLTPTEIYVSYVASYSGVGPPTDSRLWRVDRASGQSKEVSLPPRAGFDFTVDGPRLLWLGSAGTSDQGLMMGELDRPYSASLIDRTVNPIFRQSISVAGTVIGYPREGVSSREAVHWWDRASARGDDLPINLAKCMRLNWAALRGRAIVWAEAYDTDQNNVSCLGPPAARTIVHFTTASADREVDVPGLQGRYILAKTFDATSTSAVVGGDAYVDVVHGATRLGSLGLKDATYFGLVRDFLYVASYTDNDNFLVYRYGSDLQGSGTPSGAGRGSVNALAHDGHGIYVLTWDHAAKELLLWVIDMDLLGCPPN